MELFEFSNTNVLPKAHTILIREFANIWNRDRSKNKDLAKKELAFIFYLMDYKSVYLSTVPEDREQMIITDLFPDDPDWTPDEIVKQACKKYAELQHGPTMRLLDAAQEQLEELVTFFKTKGLLNKVDRAGKPIYKPGDITKAMADTSKVAESIDVLRERVRKELSLKGRIRGGGESGEYED